MRELCHFCIFGKRIHAYRKIANYVGTYVINANACHELIVAYPLSCRYFSYISSLSGLANFMNAYTLK